MLLEKTRIRTVPREGRKVVGIPADTHKRMARFLKVVNKSLKRDEEDVSLASLATYILECYLDKEEAHLGS